MFDGIDDHRIANLTGREKRWLNNIKKAFYASDQAYQLGHKEDRCFEELCKAIDTAKTLRRSLKGEDTSGKYNKARFTEFLDCEVPPPDKGGMAIQLVDSRTGAKADYSFSGLVYAIRCMVHENENLNAAEKPDYHIQLDWSMPTHDRVMGRLDNGRLILNAELFWHRLREVLSKFITGIDATIAFHSGAKSFSIRIDTPLGSIRPDGV